MDIKKDMVLYLSIEMKNLKKNLKDIKKIVSIGIKKS